ncbi:MAG TPA: hypothetical protein VL285_22790 [Bryobacteraceae bacterium]|jgi:hypothetical protein|nr:hypothetical protein [Bryobacteraceae bacterium]
MRRNRIARGLKFALLAAAAAAGFNFLFMTLWNQVAPAVFGWHAIDFWQSLGLLVLSRILFGGFRRGPGYSMRWRRRMFERWERMTPEEREKFRRGMQNRCGPFRPPETEVKV